jgi:hypothetical protein
MPICSGAELTSILPSTATLAILSEILKLTIIDCPSEKLNFATMQVKHSESQATMSKVMRRS